MFTTGVQFSSCAPPSGGYDNPAANGDSSIETLNAPSFHNEGISALPPLWEDFDISLLRPISSDSLVRLAIDETTPIGATGSPGFPKKQWLIDSSHAGEILREFQKLPRGEAGITPSGSHATGNTMLYYPAKLYVTTAADITTTVCQGKDTGLDPDQRWSFVTQFSLQEFARQLDTFESERDWQTHQRMIQLFSEKQNTRRLDELSQLSRYNMANETNGKVRRLSCESPDFGEVRARHAKRKDTSQ